MVIMAKREPVKRKGIAKPTLKKMSFKKWALVIVIVLGSLFYWWAMQPIIYNGTILFGICRTYIELNTQYPSELEFIDLRERGSKVSVEYVTNDAFGQHIAHEANCNFKRGENGELLLDSFRLRRGIAARDYSFAIENPEKIQAFNKTIPSIVANPPPLYVFGPAEEIRDLKRK